MMVTAFGVTVLSVYLPISHAELIEPTQTLDGKQEPKGRLTILSEPPGLKIILDGQEMGNTPAFLLEIEEGIHTLQVNDSETEIYISPGKTLKLSLHKERFIFISVAEKEVESQSGSEAIRETGKIGSKRPRDPVKSRNEINRRQAIDRFNEFLKGTKEDF
jgi:hypothetical protein